MPTDSLALVEAPAAAQEAFEWPPREIIERILGWLSKPDLLNVRLVNKNLGTIAISALIQRNIPNTQTVEKLFLKNLTPVGFWEGKNLNFFRNAPVKELCIQEKNLSAETLKALISAFPTALEKLSLYYNDIEGEVTKVLAKKLPTIPKLESLYVLDSKIGDEGLNALLEAISRTDLEYLTISVLKTSPLRKQFEHPLNRQGQPINVTFM
ncbi:MAG: F-box protein [Alphaproteobacteria bacterium]